MLEKMARFALVVVGLPLFLGMLGCDGRMGVGSVFAASSSSIETCSKKLHGRWLAAVPENATDEEKLAAALLCITVFEFDMDQMKMSTRLGEQGESIGIIVKECDDTRVVLLPAEIEKEEGNEPITINVIGEDKIQLLGKDEKPMILERRAADVAPPPPFEMCKKKIHGQWTMSMPENATEEDEMAAALLGAMVFEFDMDQMKMSMRFGDQGESIDIIVKDCDDTRVVLLPAAIKRESESEPLIIKVIGKDELRILSKDDKPMTLRRKNAE